MADREFREREVAIRVLSREITASTIEVKGAGDGTRSYLLSPLGSQMNRVLLYGKLTRVEKAGQEGSMLRARLEDPTGSISVTAGTYNPRAMAFLSQVTPPHHVVLIGKTHLFVSDRGQRYISVRAEGFATVDDAELGLGLTEAAEHTVQRVALMQAVSHDPPPGREELLRMGHTPGSVTGSLEAVKAYPGTDPGAFLEDARRALKSVLELTPPA